METKGNKWGRKIKKGKTLIIFAFLAFFVATCYLTCHSVSADLQATFERSILFSLDKAKEKKI